MSNPLIAQSLCIFGLITSPCWVLGASYPLPEPGNFLVGEIQYVDISAGDTLLDVAREYDLGYNEMLAANPQVNPWLPGDSRIVVPTQFILPEPPWEGIIVNLPEMRLYYFPETETAGTPRRVITFPIGIGRQGRDTPPGEYQIITKIENPNWTIPGKAYQQMLAEGYQGPRLVPAGPDNPLGKFAMQLNDDGLFIHGTNKPFSIGMRVSNGCVRLYPEDIAQLIAQVPKGVKVRIIEQPYKLGQQNGKLFLESHQPIEKSQQAVSNMTPLVSGIVRMTDRERSEPIDWDYVFNMANSFSGIPIPVENPEPRFVR